MNITSKKETPERPHEKAKAEGPPIQTHPKMLYHPDGRSMTAATPEDEKTATEQGFLDTPQPPPAEKPEKKG